ncbi:MAG: hypothetical protein JWO13_1574 [Acidobacteriales bacterium]|nr:hypothetical protein [Terriglobales bacterium]
MTKINLKLLAAVLVAIPICLSAGMGVSKKYMGPGSDR